MKLMKSVAAIAAGLVIVGAASAQEYYVGGSIGFTQQNDSDNSGSTGAFTTGNLGDGSTLDVAAGTPYGWSTEFDGGTAFAGEFGARYGNGFRSGIEIVYSQADVDTHTGVTLGGGSIDGVDAAAIASSADPLGVTVAQVVADGRGEITNTGIFINGYYDFNQAGAFQPYVGGGIGYVDVDVTYQPSGITVIDDSEGKFGYQLKAGATYKLQNQWEVFGEYAYRATEDIELNNQLFPGTLEIENTQNVFSIGARYKFGG
ncbi:MAG: porin family protein [Hyphomonadaceae bacterium]|nr:porin family protein [Hyphomonadaceae bacterium]